MCACGAEAEKAFSGKREQNRVYRVLVRIVKHCATLQTQFTIRITFSLPCSAWHVHTGIMQLVSIATRTKKSYEMKTVKHVATFDLFLAVIIPVIIVNALSWGTLNHQ